MWAVHKKDYNNINSFCMEFNIILTSLIGAVLLAIVGVIIYIYIVVEKMKQQAESDRKDLYKLVMYVKLYDKVLYNMIRYIQGDKYFNMMDLAEFRNLDPAIKEKYRKYIVEMLMKKVVDFLNKNKHSKVLSDDKLKALVDQAKERIPMNDT